MLHREDPNGIVCITQPTHAWVAGKLARAWGNARFPLPEPREEVCLAAERHDDGAGGRCGRDGAEDGRRAPSPRRLGLSVPGPFLLPSAWAQGPVVVEAFPAATEGPVFLLDRLPLRHVTHAAPNGQSITEAAHSRMGQG